MTLILPTAGQIRYQYTNESCLIQSAERFRLFDLRFAWLWRVRWSLQGPGEISENIIYNNGYRNPDGTGAGHAIYGINTLGGLKTIARNLFFKQFGRYTIHLYTDGSQCTQGFSLY